jgi:hypothetical protein
MTIEVRTDTVAARWARWTARGRIAPVDALEVSAQRRMAFVPNQVLVADNAELVQRLMEEHGAEVVPAPELPPPPDGMGPRDGVDTTAMPIPVTLRIVDPPPASQRAAELLAGRFERPVSVTSERAARLLGLVLELAADGHPITVDCVGQTVALPLLTAAEGVVQGGGTLDSFAISQYNKPMRVDAAWQLIEAYRKFRSTKSLVTVGVLDGGFWLNGKVPGFPLGQSGSDFGSAVLQLNLLDESVGAGGANPNKCTAPPSTATNPFPSSYTCPWHGNGVASVATAPVGNALGAAGVGGTVARPVLFKSELSVSQIYRCLQVCLAWGVDVLNMSFTIENFLVDLSTDAWNNAFQFASDNGLIMVAAAGNDSTRLPEDGDPRPATRTPGTITVGALNGLQPRSDSNYGSSIDIWAPGTGLPAMPDPNNPNGLPFSGTSAAAPYISGVAAMMRAVAPSITPARVKELLLQTAWHNDTVSGGVDAFAAVLAAMGGRLPDDDSEPDDTTQSAKPLQVSGPGGRHLTPPRLTGDAMAALSSRADEDWYRFTAPGYAQLDLKLGCYPLLGSVLVTVEPDDPDSRAPEEIASTYAPGTTRLQGLLAPGGYQVHVRGSVNLYELSVDLADVPMLPDEFEPNDTFDTATDIHLRDPGGITAVVDPASPGGTFDLTLHTVSDADYFQIQSSSANPLTQPVVRVTKSDFPLDVTVYDAARTQIDQRVGVRSTKIVLPIGSTHYLAVTSAGHLNRYRLSARLEIDEARLPGPQQRPEVVPVPDPGDPFRIFDQVSHLYLELDQARRAADPLIFAAEEGQQLYAEVMDDNGAIIARAEPSNQTSFSFTALDLAQLPLGNYLIQLTAKSETSGPVHVELLPATTGHT